MKGKRFDYYVSIDGIERVNSCLTADSEKIEITIPLNTLLKLTLGILENRVGFEFGDEDVIAKIKDALI